MTELTICFCPVWLFHTTLLLKKILRQSDAQSRKKIHSLFIADQILNSSHGHRRSLVLLMIIRLVAQSDFLLTDSPHELALHMTTRRIRRRERFPENVAHMVEEPYGTEENGRVTLPIIQEELCIAITLSLIHI